MELNIQVNDDVDILNFIDLCLVDLFSEDKINEIFADNCTPNVPSPTIQQDNFSSSLPPLYEDISDDDSSSVTRLNIQDFPSDIKDWDNTHIMKWILELYDKKNYRYEDLNIHYFRNKTGSCLKDLEESIWKKIDNKRGSWLYKEVQCLIKDLKYKREFVSPTILSQNYEVECYGSQPSDEPTQTNVPRKRGRPPKLNTKPRNKEKVGRIWEFLRDLLKDKEYCPKFIRWDNYDKLEFRLVDPRKICEIWGQKKGKEISYEHFSRSIRHYYNLNKDDPESNKAKILSVPDRRLVYKFNRDALEAEDFRQFLKCSGIN